MCSRGSVIPLFVKQIKEKTFDNYRSKYDKISNVFDDAVNLVFHAFENANREIFISKIICVYNKRFSIALKEIFNYKINDSIIGTRNCEKLYESLLSKKKWHELKIKEVF